MPNFKLAEDEIFEHAFEKAALAKMDAEDRDRYEYSLKVYRDLKNTIDSSFDNGREEGREVGKEKGREEERILIAKNLKAASVPVAIIQSTTGLSNEAINEL